MIDNSTAAAALYGSPNIPQQPAPRVESPVSDPAAVLYGGEPRQETTPLDSEPIDQAHLEDALYGEEEPPAANVPDEVKAAREADSMRKLYSPQTTFQGVIPDDLFSGNEHVAHVPEAVQKAAVRELREMAADLGMTSLDVQAYQSISRGITEEPTQEARQGWREEAVQRLNATYGDGAAQVLRDARAFIGQDPRRAQMLNANGLGDHPETVMLFAKLARQARMAGKLK